MKRLIVSLLLAFAVVAFGQEGSIKPEFQAFAGALIKLKEAKGGYHKFTLKVNVAPWAFKATGEVRAPGGDSDVLFNALFDGDLYAVLAYIPSNTPGSDGLEYQAGLFDMMLYYEEDATTIRNLQFELLPPIDDDWAKGTLKDASESGSLLGQIWKGKYDRDIVKASANPIDKKALKNMAKKQQAAAPIAEDQSVSKKRKKHMEEMAQEEEVKPKKKKKKSADDCDSPSMSAKEKRRCQMKKK